MAKVNTLNPRSFESIIGKISQSAGLDKTEVIQLRSAFQKVDLTLNDDGSVKHQANVSGRTEPLSTTLTHVAATGNFDSLANVNDTSTDHLTDGTGTPLQGGKNATLGLGTSGQLLGTLKNNPVNSNGAFTGSNPLSQHLTSTQIDVAGWTMQFGNHAVFAGAGSVDPGSLGTFYVYIDNPTFNSFIGSPTYLTTANVSELQNSDGIMVLGKITTIGGGGASGLGTGGGGSSGIRALL